MARIAYQRERRPLESSRFQGIDTASACLFCELWPNGSADLNPCLEASLIERP